jgi:hypothetical protein
LAQLFHSEEAYSLAILLFEQMEQLKQGDWRAGVATDTQTTDAIATAPFTSPISGVATRHQTCDWRTSSVGTRAGPAIEQILRCW